MKKVSLLIAMMTCCLDATMGSAWVQSKAAAYGQQEKWQEAQACINQLMIDSPDQPDLLYDNGVAAYRLAEFAKAAAYFENVTKINDVEKDLKKQAHFNWGNTNVALNQLPQAITQYEQVLAMEPDNQQAQHNLKKVKEMIKQQEQKEQQKKKQDQSKNNQQNNNNEDKQDEQTHESPDQKNDSDNQQNENQRSSDAQKNGSSKSSNKNERNAANSSGGNQEKEDDTHDQQDRQQQSKPNDKSSQQDRNQEQNKFRDSHDSSSETPTKQQTQKRRSKDNAQPTKNESKEQATQQGMLQESQNDRSSPVEPEFGSHEKWMARVLAQQEKADKAAQKVLIKTNINKQLAGHNGQNCW